MTFFAEHAGDAELQKWRLYFLGLSRTTRVAAPVAAGSHAVTPASMTGIEVDMILTVSDANGTLTENVTVTGTTTSTFTATFLAAHAANWIVGIPAPLFWTDCDIDIEWNGRTWVAKPIMPGPVQTQPTGATAAFQIADADNDLFPLLAACNGGELAFAAIYEAGFALGNGSPTPDEVIEIFAGRVDRAAFDTGSADVCEISMVQPQGATVGFIPSRLLSTLVRST